MRTLKKQFTATALAIVFFLLTLGFFTNLAIRQITLNYKLSSQLDHLAYLEISLASTERDFLLYESVNPEFFRSGKSRYIQKMDSLLNINRLIIQEVAANPVTKRLQLNTRLDLLSQHYVEIEKLFFELNSALFSYGYENYGLSGIMRQHIHQVEQTLDNANQHELTSLMLMLRRHEKDFMLRKDKRYLERFDDSYELFVTRLRDMEVDSGLEEKAGNYRTSFYQLAAKEMEIGSSSNQGLLFLIDQQFNAIDPLLSGLKYEVTMYSQSRVRSYMIILITAFIVLPFFIIYFYQRLSGRLLPKLLAFRDYIVMLGEGSLPERIEKQSNDEIGQMVDSINTLAENLRNTRDFANEVGKGNFNTDINVFGNQGDLGGSLIQMKNQLEEVAKRQEIQKQEEVQRTWSAEGIALFARIMRSNNASVNDLSVDIIINLVKYMGLTQGGIYLAEENQSRKYFKLVGCYAFDRRKFHQQIIEWNEGLIGACAFEKDSVYMTDLPQSYITITSGLGQVNPDCILLIPLIYEDEVIGVIELTGFGMIEPYRREFAKRISETIAAHISIMRINLHTAELLKKSQEMAENLRQQEEELKQNMEEMITTQEESERVIQNLRRKLNHKENNHAILT